MLRLALYCSLVCLGASSVFGARIKDLTDVRGSRSNQLYGYGIVTGLAGQGDSRIEYTELGILNALESLGIRADKADKSRIIAAVMVTADIGPFAKEGAKMDVTVSSIGNADSLQGGVLLQTPLYGADGKVYSVAQGPVSVGGLSAGNAGGANAQVNHPTVGMVSNGATVERDREPSPQKRGIGTYSKISRLIDCGQDCRRREPILPRDFIGQRWRSGQHSGSRQLPRSND